MTEQKREFKGIWIPKEIWLRDDLNVMDKFTLSEIDSFEGKNGCFASNQYLGSILKISPSRVSQIVTKLKNLGLIEVTLTYRPHSKEVDKRFIKVNKSAIFSIK